MTTMIQTVDRDPVPRTGLVSLDGRAYPLESAAIEARAEGGVALSVLRQRFRNPHTEPLEVLYTLPLPADGAVLGYAIVVGERRITGEIRTRDEADAAYRTALYEGRTAGLLEEDRSDTFRQKLGNVAAETPVEVEIHVLHPLAFRPGVSGAEWEYRFPTTVGVRYMGAPGRVPDAERLSPNRTEGGVPARLSASVLVVGEGLGPEGAEMADPAPHTVRSPSHEVAAEAGNGGLHVRLREEARMNRDLVIRWHALAPEVGVHLTEGTGLEGDDGRYALLTLLPPEAPEAVQSRDVTVLLDTSGSMHGPPLTLANSVVDRVLSSLAPEDRFELLTFGTRTSSQTNGMVPADPAAVGNARSVLHKLSASGGTEMRSAVTRALKTPSSDAQRQVILVTDGYIGFEGEVVAEAMRGLPEGVRFHAVGVGSSPNRTLTGGLARAGRGLELFAMDEDSAEECAHELEAATARPVLSDLTVSGPGVIAVAPARPRDVMADRPTIFTAELSPGGGRVEVSGRLAGHRERWSRVVDLPARTDSVPSVSRLPLGALHGREVIADLEIEEAAGSTRESVDAKIQKRGLRHRIVSRRTSLVAVSDTATVDPRSPRRRETLEVELPAGVSAEGVGLTRPRAAARRGQPRADTICRASTGFLDVHDVSEGDLDLGPSADEALMSFRVFEPRRSEIKPSRERSIEPPRRRDIEVDGAEILLHHAEFLVVEFETPSADFRMPRDRVNLRLPDGTKARARVLAEESTPTGPHPRGIRVRVGLRLESGSWPVGRPIRIWWEEKPSGRGHSAVRWHLDLVLPTPRDRTARR